MLKGHFTRSVIKAAKLSIQDCTTDS